MKKDRRPARSALQQPAQNASALLSGAAMIPIHRSQAVVNRSKPGTAFVGQGVLAELQNLA